MEQAVTFSSIIKIQLLGDGSTPEYGKKIDEGINGQFSRWQQTNPAA